MKTKEELISELFYKVELHDGGNRCINFNTAKSCINKFFEGMVIVDKEILLEMVEEIAETTDETLGQVVDEYDLNEMFG
jgi:hypothetical protein